MRSPRIPKWLMAILVMAFTLTGVGLTSPAAQAAPTMLVGASASGPELPEVYQQLPGTDITRVFFGPGQTPRWDDSRLTLMDQKNVIPFVSMKDYNPTAAARFVSALPPTVPTLYFTWHHEPEQGSDALTASTFRRNFCSVYDAIRTTRPYRDGRVKVISAQTRQWTENKNGGDYSDYFPGRNCTDAFGVDAYVDSWKLTTDPTTSPTYPYGFGYPKPETFLSKMQAFARQVGEPLFLVELGASRAPGDTTGAARAAWIQKTIELYRNGGGIGVIWWQDTADSGTDYRLNIVNGWNDPAATYWRQLSQS